MVNKFHWKPTRIIAFRHSGGKITPLIKHINFYCLKMKSCCLMTSKITCCELFLYLFSRTTVNHVLTFEKKSKRGKRCSRKSSPTKKYIPCLKKLYVNQENSCWIWNWSKNFFIDTKPSILWIRLIALFTERMWVVLYSCWILIEVVTEVVLLNYFKSIWKFDFLSKLRFYHSNACV